MNSVANFLITCFIASCAGDSSPLSKLFSAQCTTDQYTEEWTGCLWPQGNLTKFVAAFAKRAGQKSCRVPPRNMLKVAEQTLNSGGYIGHPLYKVIPADSCGFCGRRVKCCPAGSFLLQSYKSDVCPQAKSYCTLPLIDQSLLSDLREKYSNLTYNENPCDYNQLYDVEYYRLQISPVYNYLKPLLCQIFGTLTPKVNCVNMGSECRCCCFSYKYANGLCLLDQNLQATAQTGC